MAAIHREMHASMRLHDLKLRHRSGLVPDLELLEANIRGYVGVRADRSAGPDKPELHFLDSHDEVVDKPYRVEYVRAVAEGHLWACDEKTAKAAARFAGCPADWSRFLAPEAPTADEPA
jgi:hypothetical protein